MLPISDQVKLGLQDDLLWARAGHSCSLVGKEKTQDSQLINLLVKDGVFLGL